MAEPPRARRERGENPKNYSTVEATRKWWWHSTANVRGADEAVLSAVIRVDLRLEHPAVAGGEVGGGSGRYRQEIGDQVLDV